MCCVIVFVHVSAEFSSSKGDWVCSASERLSSYLEVEQGGPIGRVEAVDMGE